VRHEDPPEEQKAETRRPLIAAHGETGSGAGAREPNKVLAADICRKQRRAYGKPTHPMSGKEIVRRGAATAGVIEANAKHQREVEQENCRIEHGC
jgi:hypothetical protein